MRVVLLNSSFVTRSRDAIQRAEPHLRVGVASIAAYLRSRGHDVTLLDPEVSGMNAQAIARRVCEFSPDFAGMPAYTEEIDDAAAVAGEIKKLAPSIVTVVGGYHVSALPLETLEEYPSFDLGVVGEGEGPFADLVSGMPLQGIAGIVWRQPHGGVCFNESTRDLLDLDKLPPPSWDLYDLDKYGDTSLPVELVRACPFNCPFCFKALGRSVRYKAPDKILAEIEATYIKRGIRRFFFVSSGTYPVSREHGLDVFRRIQARGLKIIWNTGARVELLDEELLRAMKESGCWLVNVGVESGDPEVLSRCGKTSDLSRVETVLKLCAQVGIETEANFILGLPGETRDSVRRTGEFVRRIRDLATIANFAVLTPYPGTQVFKMAVNGEQGLGLRTREWRAYTKHSGSVLRHSSFTPEELRELQMQFYRMFYLSSLRKILQLLRSRSGRELLSVRRVFTLLTRGIRFRGAP